MPHSPILVQGKLTPSQHVGICTDILKAIEISNATSKTHADHAAQ